MASRARSRIALEAQEAGAPDRGEPRVSSARFSAIDSAPTMPSRWRSSGMRPTPASIMARGDGLVTVRRQA